MITSNVNELQFLANVKKDELNIKNDDFIKEIKNSSKNEELSTSKTNSLTYKNIKNITLEEIDFLFKNDEDKQMAKNLRLATLFSDDENLSKAMFNTVLGKPFNLGYSYLTNRYEDKHNYFSSLNSKQDLTSLLHKSIVSKNTDTELKAHEQISQEMLDEVLLEVNSFSFLDAFSTTSYDQYNRYKDEKNDYSFLYKDYYLQYQELTQEYKKTQDEINNIINQF